MSVKPSLSLLLFASFPVICSGQATPPAPPTVPPPAPTVYSNPRAPHADPRVGLKPGLYDAGEAAFGLERLTSLPKPPGFAPVVPDPNAAVPKEGSPEAIAAARARYGSTNSDLAFSGNHLFVGNYNGINFYDIDNPAKTALGTSLVCPGGQGDVSVYGHLLFMSAEATNGRIDCGTQGVPVPSGYVMPALPPAAPV